MKRGIDAERWSKVRATFDELVDLDTAAQRDRLREIIATDQELARDVETLLHADVNAESRLARLEEALVSGPQQNEASHPPDPLHLIGRTIAHFKVIAPLAAGGMGAVYRAEDTKLQRTIALKFPLPPQHFDRSAKERFLLEARSAGGLDHPNICSIYETGETSDGHLFLAMPLYEGETLKARLARAGAFAVADAVEIAKQIAAGLSAAHNAGVVHRDVKPANVMLLRDGNVRILDFGLAKARDLNLTATHARVGTVSYMAPEQIEGKRIDGRADLWSLGVILYEMVTGRRPFEGEHDVSIAHAIVHRDAVPVASVRQDVPAEVAHVISRLLEKEPARRYDSAEYVVAELLAVQRGESRKLHHAHTRIWRLPRWKIAGVALLAIAVIGAAAWFLRFGGASAAAPRSVAVLPFVDLSHSDDSRYLAVALADAIATDLTRLRALIVPSRHSTARYADSSQPISDIARELDASAVLRAGVRRVGDRVTLHASVFDAGSASPIWTRQYEGSIADLPDIKDRATRDIVKALHVRLSRPERALVTRPPTTNAQAYDLYLRGRELEIRGAPRTLIGTPQDNMEQARSLYSRARDLDPDFALARARLAFTHLYSVLRSEERAARREQARLEAETALRLQPGLAEAHQALAIYWISQNDYGRAIDESILALQGFPNSADAHLYLGNNYRAKGRWQESVSELRRAMELDPRNVNAAANAATTFALMRLYEEAIRVWDGVITLTPNEPAARLARAQLYMMWQGTADSVAATLERIPGNWDRDGVATFSRFTVLRIQRRYDDALAMLAAARTQISRDGVTYRPVTLMRAQLLDALGKEARAPVTKPRAPPSPTVLLHIRVMPACATPLQWHMRAWAARPRRRARHAVQWNWCRSQPTMRSAQLSWRERFRRS